MARRDKTITRRRKSKVPLESRQETWGEHRGRKRVGVRKDTNCLRDGAPKGGDLTSAPKRRKQVGENPWWMCGKDVSTSFEKKGSISAITVGGTPCTAKFKH